MDRTWRWGTAALVTLACSAAVAFAAQDGWKLYDDGNFRVLLPGKPAVTHSTAGSEFGTVPSSAVSLNTGGELFQVGYTDYPTAGLAASSMPVDDRLAAMLHESVGHVDGSVLAERKISLNGVPGREIRAKLSSAAGPQIFIDRDYLVRNRLYEVGVMAPLSEDASPRLRKFLDSFRCMAAPGSVVPPRK